MTFFKKHMDLIVVYINFSSNISKINFYVLTVKAFITI